MRLIPFLIPLTLAACAVAPPYPDEPNGVKRIFATWQDAPFDNGVTWVVTEEHGEIHTYAFAACRDGTAVCAGSAHGPAGHLDTEGDFAVVTGLYGGRTFLFSPGGDGYVRYRGDLHPLAWDDANSTTLLAPTLAVDGEIAEL